MLNISEVGTVSERIIMLIKHFSQGNKAAFGRAADIQSGVLAGIIGGRESKPGFEILQKLLTAYPTVNPKWLLFGQGEMLEGKPLHSLTSSKANDELTLPREVPTNATREELELLRNQVYQELSELELKEHALSDLYIKIKRKLAHLDL